MLCLVMNSTIHLLGLLLLFVGFVSTGGPSAQNQTRIAGGWLVQQQWPFFAGVMNRRVFNDYPYCGAVIWDENTVITAAHCLMNKKISVHKIKEFEVFMGDISWLEPKDPNYLFRVKDIFIHPDFDVGENHHDIALIKLDRPIDFESANSRVDCAPDPEPRNLVNTGQCMAIGWGQMNDGFYPTHLVEVELPVLPNQICAFHSPDSFYSNSHICAGYLTEEGVGICGGDSGGPFVCPLKADPSKYSLIAISCFSYGDPPDCGKCLPSYFTKINPFLEWIAAPVKHHLQMSFWDRIWTSFPDLWGKPNVNRTDFRRRLAYQNRRT